jgi:Fe-S oxidoreductase
MKMPFYPAKDKDFEAAGLPLPAKAEQENKLTALTAEYRRKIRSLIVALDVCTKCGACAKQCHSYLGTEDYNNIPAARADLFREFYKRHCTIAGRFLARLTGKAEMAEDILDEWAAYFYQCNECRRCAVFCPFGIDTAEVTIAARQILSQLGVAPRFFTGITANLARTGNNMGLTKPALLDSCAFLESEIKEETGVVVQIPVDKSNADVLYLPSSADFFVNAETMMGAAKLFHFLGINWTISSTLIEAANFGLLFNQAVMDEHNERIKQAAATVGASMIIHGECGHGWRAVRMRQKGENSTGLENVHILDYAYRRLSTLKLNILPLKVTLHDPCNYTRAGELCEQPRAIIRSCVADFVEMKPNREETFCCGAGSGLLMDEMLNIRLKLGKKKAGQIREVGSIDYLAAPCSICKAQLPELIKHYRLRVGAVGGVIDLLGKALVLK